MLGFKAPSLCSALFVAASLVAASVSTAPAATGGIVVSANIVSATNLDTSGCANASPGRTDFGLVLPGTLAVTPLDCSITFGSSNDTARLRIGQTDTRGRGMFQTTRGALDPSFDTDGRVATATAPGSGGDEANAVAVQSDGRVVTAGKCDMGAATGYDACLARYNTDGSLDTSFDGDGRVTTAIAPGASQDNFKGVALQRDGRIVAAGYCYMGAATGLDVCVARYNTDGSLDTTFDADGWVTTPIAPGAGDDYVSAVIVQADGRIITAGSCLLGATGYDACLVRYNTDGSLDTTFDTDGKVTTATAAGGGQDYANAIALQTDGRFVTAGNCDMGGATGRDFCLARYNTDGSLDTTFDADGRATTAIALGTGNDFSYAIAVQGDGRIVTAGECQMGGATGVDACLARNNPDGSLDSSFDTDGRVNTPGSLGAGYDAAYASVLQADGRILTAGYCDPGGASGGDACLARYNANGTLDTTFDDDGRLTTALAPGAGDESANAAAMQTDGRIVIAGYCDMGAVTGYDVCLAQYAPGGIVSQYADAVTDWDTPSTSLFGACLLGSAGATSAWTTSATCPTTDGPYWNAVPPTQGLLATATANTTTATANLRFGLRTAPSQPPGAYIAPVTFDVVAP